MDDRFFSFEEFSVEMGDFEVRKTRKHDRMWQANPGGSLCCIPLLREGVLYVGCCNRNIYAIDARTGSLVWKFRTSGIVLESSPAYWGGMIFAGSFDQNMYALDAKTGRLVWKFKTEGEIDVMPWAENGRVYFGSRDHNVYCLEASTGRLVWKFRAADEIVAAPALRDGRLFIGSFDQNMYCLDAASGRLIWKFATQGEIHNINYLLVHEGVLYFTSFDNHLYAVGEESGRLLWKMKTGIYGNNSSPVLHEGRLYLPTRDGTLYALSLDGKVLWKFSKNEQVLTPTIHEGRIYFGCEDHNLYCIDMDGRERWKFTAQGGVFLRPVVEGNVIYFPSWDCHVYAVDARARRLVWKFRTEGSPSHLPPAWDMFELVVKTRGEESDVHEERKRYDLVAGADEEMSGFYKSRITYQISSQYAAKGKYRSEGDGF